MRNESQEIRKMKGEITIQKKKRKDIDEGEEKVTNTEPLPSLHFVTWVPKLVVFVRFLYI
jgi:hypothetical protein